MRSHQDQKIDGRFAECVHLSTFFYFFADLPLLESIGEKFFFYFFIIVRVAYSHLLVEGLLGFWL